MGLRTGVKLVGIKQARAALAAAKGLSQRYVLLRRLELHWDDTVLAITGLAQEKAPVKHGHLRGSATSRSEFNGAQLVGQIQFGGLASKYAGIQHERRDFVHPKGGEDHFLYGARYSAWEESRAGALAALDRDAARIAEDEIGGAAVG